MKNIVRKFLLILLLIGISFFSQAAELISASWSAGSNVTSVATTYTFSYQTVTASPYYAFYAIFPAGFSCAGVSDITITVDGTPATVSGISFVSGPIVKIALSNPALVTAGSTITVTALITNASTAGIKTWSCIRTANSAGTVIDQISAPANIVLVYPAPAAPIAISASSITTSGFKAYWNTVVNALSYRMDLSTASDFSSFVPGFNDLDVGNTFFYTLTGLTPGVTYYYRVRASNASGVSSSSNTIAATTSKLAASVILTSLSQTYDGTARSASANTSPSGLAMDFTYDGSSVVPTNAGSYAVVGTVNDPTYKGTATGTLVISKATIPVSLGNLAHFYDGTSKAALVVTNPSGLMADITYDGSSLAPSAVGTYAVVATLNDNNYVGTVSGTLVISRGVPVISITSLNQEYDGSAKPVVVTTVPSNLPVTVTYNGSTTVPVNAGSYLVEATVDDVNYLGAATAFLEVAKAPTVISLLNLSAAYDGFSKTILANTNPSGLALDITYDGSTAPPVNEGVYVVEARVNNANYQGIVVANFTITKITATKEYYENKLSLHPNPSSDFIKIENTSALKRMELIGPSGASVLTKENCASEEILDVRNLPKGVYRIILEAPERKEVYSIVVN